MNDFYKYLSNIKKSIENISEEEMDKYIISCIENKKNSREHLRDLAHEVLKAGREDLYIYFTGYFGSVGVVESILEKAISVIGKEKTDEIIRGLELKPFGTPAGKMPVFTSELVNKFLKGTDDKEFRLIFAGNNHGIPAEAFELEKLAYQEAKDMDEYLKGRHRRKIMELEKFMHDNKIWFEQRITQKVIDHVKGNQEILSAVRDGNRLYVTKIPFDTEKYLDSEGNERLYHACHCYFARKSLLEGEKSVPYEWCNCSAGFAKYPFEVILGRQLEVRVLESPLKGDDRCRFEITI